MNKDILEQGVFILGRQFPEKSFDVKILWEFLRDLTDKQYMSSIKEIVASKEEVNKATNIIAMIRNKALCNDLKTAGEAWAIVLRAVSKIGSYGVPKFIDPSTQKSVDAIGWRNICLSENPMVERAHFLKIYETIALREKNKILSEPVKLLVGGITKQIGKQ